MDMASSAEEVQVSSPAPVEAEHASADANVVELPAPEGWTKKLFPKKKGTPKRDDVVYYAPTGEEIKSRAQLDRYLKSHPGGPPISEFNWSAGVTPRRSSRLSEKVQGEAETPESEAKKKPNRSRKSDAGSEDNKHAKKRRKSEASSAEKEASKEEEMQDVDCDEDLKKEELTTPHADEDDSGKKGEQEEVKQEEKEIKHDDTLEGSKAEDVQMQEACESIEDKPVKETEAAVEEDRSGDKPGVQIEEDALVKESEVNVKEEKTTVKEPEVHVQEYKTGKEAEVLVEECKSGNKDEVHAEDKATNEPEVCAVEEGKTDLAAEINAENEEAYENGVRTEREVPIHVEPQEPLDVKKENGHDGTTCGGNSEQHKPADPVEVVNYESKDKNVTQAIGKTEELQSSYNGEAQEPSGPLSANS